MSSSFSPLGSIGSISSSLPKLPPLESEGPEGGFSGVLSTAINHVNELSSGADQQIGNMLKGGSGDMSSVMVAIEKADVAFQMMMQVRNKIVSAYQDIEKMQF
jgi:flagellar hook-basal body complex protein FliE